ncbi:hypothetical protein [Chloroflexus sp.]|uniref:hypothetical protein n=1 Tax=Chloroflexus sp. TaxID=1904827 RepID=UPI002ACE7762|nr:hypothetical protein [Chloroflexus sp.]
MKWKALNLFILIAILNGCIIEEAGNSERITITTSTATSPEATLGAIPPTEVALESPTHADHAHAETPAKMDQEVSEKWKSHSWNKLNIPLPPNATWQDFSFTSNQINGLPIEASGMVVYNSEQSTLGENPEGPYFVILKYTGTITDWMELEVNSETSVGNPVQEDTIREFLVAGILGRAYRRAITGTGFIEYYAVKLDHDSLLWITNNDSSNNLYNQIIEGLIIY